MLARGPKAPKLRRCGRCSEAAKKAKADKKGTHDIPNDLSTQGHVRLTCPVRLAAKKATLRKEEEAPASNGEGPAPASPKDLHMEAEAVASGEKGKSFLIQNIRQSPRPRTPKTSKARGPAAGSSPAPAFKGTLIIRARFASLLY
ncbi:hypothetical protein N7471_013251 [Penicillium samsonianum]|uniref:uncharacterized protein n=1 Tax=Penicillium samsonianum TaxID=1882272 RepID=UPI0025477E7A|nr:uncharacterized protein N7471_013251 [Penicillium samsonianum]KAJ6118631.1 hypothetical protein N7471_013251 [Penicillium samsonianum]